MTCAWCSQTYIEVYVIERMTMIKPRNCQRFNILDVLWPTGCRLSVAFSHKAQEHNVIIIQFEVKGLKFFTYGYWRTCSQASK